MDAQKKSFVATEQLTPEVQAARHAWKAEQIPNLNAPDLVFLDEAGVNLGMTPAYGWSPEGARAVDDKPKDPGSNVTMIAGISLEGTIAPRVLRGGLGGDDFLLVGGAVWFVQTDFEAQPAIGKGHRAG